jgi:Outer membrane protein beta-barrel domain
MTKFNLFIVFLCVTSFVSAQKSRFEFGIETGINVSKIQKFNWANREIPLQEPSLLMGKQVALSLRYRISEHWLLKTELSGIQKGWKGQRTPTTYWCATGLTSQQMAKLAEQYLEDLRTPKDNALYYMPIPLLIEYSFVKQRLYVQLGGYWATRGYFYDDTMESKDIGGSIGIGAKLPLSKYLKLNFETRYSQGFSNVFKERITVNYGSGYSWSYPAEETGKVNQTLAINMGLFFTWH